MAAFVGWGTVLNRMLARSGELDWGLRAGWGLALTISLGGILNVLGAVSATVIVVYLVAGAGVFAVDVLRRRVVLGQRVSAGYIGARRHRLVAIAAAGVVVLALVQLAGSARGEPFNGFTSAFPYFNNNDDFQAYFVFPREMLETGSLERDPFNERRITSSLGGKSFLDAIVLAGLSEQNLHLMDPGLGMLIVLGLLVGLLTRMRAPPGAVVAACLLPLLVAPPIENISSVTISFALFLTLIRTLALGETWPIAARVAQISISVAGLVATKNSVIPATALLLAIWYASALRRPWLRVAIEGFAVIGLSVALVSPWLIELHRSSNTYLFPLLGKGFHGTRYGTFYSPFDGLSARHVLHLIATTASSLPVLALVLITVMFFRGPARDNSLARASGALAVSAIIGSFAVALLIGFDFYRYSYAFLMPALTVLLVGIAIGRRDEARPTPTRLLVPVLVVGLLVGASWESDKSYYRGLLDAMRAEAGSGLPLIPAGQRQTYRAMQNAVPARAVILSRVERPFLFDFRRNRVFVVDWPGGASPPPGMPTTAGAPALASYLAQHGIRYVAYSYAREGGFPRKDFAFRLHLAPHSFDRIAAGQALSFQKELAALGKTRKHVYDDGSNYVLDLAAP